MKKALFLALLPALAFAGVEDVVGLEEVLLEIAKFVGSLSGASLLVIVGSAVQLLMRVFQSPLGVMAGKYRLLVVCVLNLLGVLVVGYSNGMSVIAALLSGVGLAALQVLVDQVHKQFFVKND